MPKNHPYIKTVITTGAGTKEWRDNFGPGSFAGWERRWGCPVFQTESGSVETAWSPLCEQEVGEQAICPQSREAVGEEPWCWWRVGQESWSQAAGRMLSSSELEAAPCPGWGVQPSAFCLEASLSSLGLLPLLSTEEPKGRAWLALMPCSPPCWEPWSFLPLCLP